MSLQGLQNEVALPFGPQVTMVRLYRPMLAVGREYTHSLIRFCTRSTILASQRHFLNSSTNGTITRVPLQIEGTLPVKKTTIHDHG